MKNSLTSKLEYYVNMYIKEKKQQNYSINTINSYLYTLNDFNEFMLGYEEEISFTQINKDIVLEYINDNKKSSNSTKDLKLRILKSFFKYIDESDSSYNFLIQFSRLKIKVEKKEHISLDENEEQRLLNLFTKTKSFNSIRDKLLITILLNTGIRASELLNIQFNDIVLDIEDNVSRILIKGKGSKQRYVYIQTQKIKNEIEYLKQYNINYIAFTNKLNTLDRVGLYRIINTKMKKANINKQGIHILRHTYAKNLVSKNVNLSTIKDILGHENISTTMIYARSNESNKMAVAGI